MGESKLELALSIDDQGSCLCKHHQLADIKSSVFIGQFSCWKMQTSVSLARLIREPWGNLQEINNDSNRLNQRLANI